MFAAITNIVLTVAIALFACLAWQATQKYARITALTLLIQQVEYVTTHGDSGNRRAAVESIRLIRSEFRDLYESLKVALGEETQKEIES